MVASDWTTNIRSFPKKILSYDWLRLIPKQSLKLSLVFIGYEKGYTSKVNVTQIDRVVSTRKAAVDTKLIRPTAITSLNITKHVFGFTFHAYLVLVSVPILVLLFLLIILTVAGWLKKIAKFIKKKNMTTKKLKG